MNPCFTSPERNELLKQYFSVLDEVRNPDRTGQDEHQQENNARSPDAERLDMRLLDLRRSYQDCLPFIPLSRCPISGKVLYHSFDPFGIDGIWWDYQSPERPPEHLPSTVVALTGSMILKEPVENFRFLCLPGPGIPFVLPRLLSQKGVVAVVSTVTCGSHTGYPVVYYMDPIIAGIPRVNTWGMNRWEFINGDGVLNWGELTIGTGEMDFNLGPWIEKGRLRWIRHGDATMELHSGNSNCPYIDMKGERRIQRVQYGKIWYEP